MNSPAAAGRGLRGWGGGLFWLGVLILIASVALGFFGARNVNLDDLDFAAEGSANLTSEQVLVVQGDAAADCSATSPSGLPVPFGPSTVQIENISIVTVVPVEDGEHTFTCENGTTFAFADQDAVAGAGTGVLAVLGAFVGALIGGFLALLGLILWLVGRSKRNKAIRNAEMYSGGYGQGYDAPPPPGYSQY